VPIIHQDNVALRAARDYNDTGALIWYVESTRVGDFEIEDVVCIEYGPVKTRTLLSQNYDHRLFHRSLDEISNYMAYNAKRKGGCEECCEVM